MSSKSFIAFRVNDEIATAIDEAVKQSRMSRSEWLTETVMIRLGMETPEARITIVVDKLEKAVGKLLSESPSKTPQKAHSEVSVEDDFVTHKQLTELVGLNSTYLSAFKYVDRDFPKVVKHTASGANLYKKEDAMAYSEKIKSMTENNKEEAIDTL
ncbi:hypothetical protein MNY64_04955 [Moellerella wisconsensis]|uniref:hypothetical protein n=1 Tax=Moellerella wisconsensis TaxID=158849 RepID=UPI001F4EAF15|nr:hypothetical protein [Moellerella wisconsensis]UNH28158.1 hypothetical protein MNY64_04955 [Moellerella wisconsensis]